MEQDAEEQPHCSGNCGWEHTKADILECSSERTALGKCAGDSEYHERYSRPQEEWLSYLPEDCLRGIYEI